jgi:hypothetical protein
MNERAAVAVAAATAVWRRAVGAIHVLTRARLAVACAVSAQNKMNLGFTPPRTADSTVLFLTSRKLQKSRLKSHRRKSRQRRQSSSRGACWSPPRLVADDPVRLDTPVLLVGFDSGFGLRAKVTIHSARISRRS